MDDPKLLWCKRINYSQGGVKVPTGGDSNCWRARERLLFAAGSSRSGEMPEPTVIVRKGENDVGRLF
jgi:hypothetical protein